MQSVDVGFTHVAFTVRCLASSIDFYTRYTAMTVIHQREPDLPSARKVAWLSDRTRPFALVLVQSDDPADTPLGPFGHLGVACATRPRSMRKWPSHGGKVFYAGSRSSWAIRWAISLSLPTRTVTPWSCRGGSGWDWKSSWRENPANNFPPPRRVRITLQRDTSATRSMAMGNKKSGNPVDTAAKIAPLDNKAYEKALRKLHVELVKLQRWVVHKGLKVCIVFEGRDGAGKGGTIKAITERVSPRIFRVVALPSPTEREKSQLYFQRYIKHLPAAGEIVIFDRSWYNRAGVERVMGFCTPEEVQKFLDGAPMVERGMVESGIILLKYWLEVSPQEQERRLRDRIDDGRKIWKLSPMDIKSFNRWDEYTAARDAMFAATDTAWAPWFVARSENKKRVRLNIITHLLSQIPYEALPVEPVTLPKRKIGKMKQTNFPFRFIPEKF